MVNRIKPTLRYAPAGAVYVDSDPALDNGESYPLRCSPAGILRVDTIATAVGPADILTSTTVAAGTVLSTVVDTHQMGVDQCFGVTVSNLVLGAGSLTILLEWSMNGTDFYPFTGGTIVIAGNVTDIYEFDYKAPYVRASKVIGVGITSATVTISHFANAS